ncbi:MAG: DUF2726 domain-containing protein, partial [Clostridiales bacterium]|nr:DUF2726 domain-containing protein [Clostridiales bacterium]
MSRYRKGFCIVVFFVSLTLFVFSLMPFFRYGTEYFWIMTVVSVALMVLSLFCLFYKPKEKEDKAKLNSRYVKKPTLISLPEYEFLQMLRQIAPDKYEVVPQVALVSVIDKKTNTAYRNELFRVCDFCFVDKDTFEPLLLVELNDSSHKRAERRDRDAKVAAICADAKLPLVTFWMNCDLSFKTVKKIVEKSI